MHVLFVCTGNTCRSPMAEALMLKIAKDKNLSVTASSAGVTAFPGAPLSQNSAIVLKEEFGIDFDHKARPVTKEELEKADLVVAVTESHKRLLCQAFGAGEKAIALPMEVGDPYGGNLASYKAAADAIRKGIETLVEEGVIHD